jgi:UPF0755 protein
MVSVFSGALTVLVVALLLVAGAAFVLLGPGPASKDTTVILRRGAGMSEMAVQLKRAHVVSSSAVFRVAAELSGADHRLKAGEYAFKAHSSIADVLALIASGKVVRHFVTLPEGRTSAQMIAALRNDPVLTGDVAVPPEGSLLPDTYEVTRGEPRAEVVRRMRAARDAVLADLWSHRPQGLPYKSPEEAVTMASIVEKETALGSERPKVAAVYVNRLRKGMKLDADPTTIYGVSKGEPLGRGLRQSELAAANPYNTYVVAGLPPTPIANAGRASLEAALNPAATQDLYFVANGTGGSSFAATYEDHSKNVAKWREVEAKRKAAKAAARPRACAPGQPCR